MTKHYLSKSTYIRGKQCVKSLYLNKFHDELRDEISDAQEAIFAKGHEIGKYAWQRFPGGTDASDGKPFEVEKSVERTRELINGGCEVIYEAAFQYNGVLCYMDILEKKNGKWKAYEVKGSTQMKNYYLDDTALQYYVITNSGLELEDISIVHLNNQYVRRGEVDVQQLFTVDSVKERILKKQREVSSNIARFRTILGSGSIPTMDIGSYCSDPYTCDFAGHCWEHIPDNSVFSINNLRGNRKFELYYSGVRSFEDITDDIRLGDAQRLQIESSLNGHKTINRPKIREFVASLNYPLYFMDFETFQPAIPLYDESRPYQQIPFQFSLHIQEKPGGEVIHKEFLADGKGDPRPEFLEALIQNIDNNGDIIVYNATFEKRILNELARDFVDFRDEISRINDHIVDLMKPFSKKHYYAPEMMGSYSIKKVLPALVPDLNYSDLEISEGGTASRSFEVLMDMPEGEEKEKLRRDMLEYCGMDTWGMVRIASALSKL